MHWPATCLSSLELHSVYLVINALFLVIHGACLRKLTSSQGFGFFAPSAARHRLVNFEHHTVPGRFSLVGQLLRNCLQTYLSVFSSSGTKSLRLARTSYFSLSGFFLLSLYLPGSSIPVSAIGQIMNVSEFENLKPTSKSRLVVPGSKARWRCGVPGAQLWPPGASSVLAQVRTTHLWLPCQLWRSLPAHIKSGHSKVPIFPFSPLHWTEAWWWSWSWWLCLSRTLSCKNSTSPKRTLGSRSLVGKWNSKRGHFSWKFHKQTNIDICLLFKIRHSLHCIQINFVFMVYVCEVLWPPSMEAFHLAGPGGDSSKD